MSIVTIVRNDPEGFLTTARSVLQQNYANMEWIVVDGASTDATSTYVRKLAPAIDQCLIEPDAGIYDAMNKGIDLVSGDWVMFLNADDTFAASSTIETYVNNLQTADDIVYADAQRREDGEIHRYRQPEEYWLGMTLDHQTACIRTAIYQELRFDSSLHSAGDLDFFSRARVAGFGFRKLQGVVSIIKPFSEGRSADYCARQRERVAVLRRYFDAPKLLRALAREFEAFRLRHPDAKSEYHALMDLIKE